MTHSQAEKEQKKKLGPTSTWLRFDRQVAWKTVGPGSQSALTAPRAGVKHGYPDFYPTPTPMVSITVSPRSSLSTVARYHSFSLIQQYRLLTHLRASLLLIESLSSNETPSSRYPDYRVGRLSTRNLFRACTTADALRPSPRMLYLPMNTYRPFAFQ